MFDEFTKPAQYGLDSILLDFFFFFKMIFTKHGRMVLLHPKGFTI